MTMAARAMMAACVCDVLGVVWWAGIFLPGTLLTLLSWPRWRELVAKAAKVDADYRDLGKLELMLGIGWGIGNFARAHLLLMVLTLPGRNRDARSASSIIRP